MGGSQIDDDRVDPPIALSVCHCCHSDHHCMATTTHTRSSTTKIIDRKKVIATLAAVIARMITHLVMQYLVWKKNDMGSIGEMCDSSGRSWILLGEIIQQSNI